MKRSQKDKLNLNIRTQEENECLEDEYAQKEEEGQRK